MNLKMQKSKLLNLQLAIKLPPTLAAVLAAGALHLHGDDTVITENTTWNGGTHDPDQDAVLLISDAIENPTLTLTNGASASWEGATVVGNLDGEFGRLVIEGASTVSNTGNPFNLGPYGDETVWRGMGFIGLNAGSAGEALVTGAGSSWTSSSWLVVGYGGAGKLEIASGGVAFSTGGSLGEFSGSVGEVLVTGAGSTWTNFSELYVGWEGAATVEIADGGAVSNSYA